MFQSGKQACIHIYIYIYQSDTEQFLSTVFLQSYEKNTYNKNNDINIRKYTRKNTFLEENIISRKTLINDIIVLKHGRMEQREGLFPNVRGRLSFQSQLKVGGTKKIVPFSSFLLIFSRRKSKIHSDSRRGTIGNEIRRDALVNNVYFPAE